jgi:flavorubredoxin
MSTRIDEIAEGIHRIATYTDLLTMNQFLVDGDEPLLFHTGFRALFADVRDAVASIVSLDRLRWIAFGHVEADECGSLNEWLAEAPNATVAHGSLGVVVQVADLADRPPHGLADGDVIDTGSHQLRYVATPHVPHGWDAGVLYDEATGTLLCGDLLHHYGDAAPLAGDDVLERALEAEDFAHATALTPQTGPTLRRLANLQPAALGIMHGSSYVGDASRLLGALASDYDRRLQEALAPAG